jgi:hypothetical protein
MSKKLLTLSFCLGALLATAQEEQEATQNKGQLNVGFESNAQWYIDDNKIQISEIDAEERIRSNSYLKLDYFIKNWEFGVQAESYTPKALLNYAPGFEKTDVGTIYARYNNTELGLNVTAGHFYEQFGSGLILRSWEDRQLGINNALFGGRVNYDTGTGINATILGGKQRIGMGFDLADSFISGADLSISISDLSNMENTDLNVGASFVSRYENLQDLYPELDKTTNMYSFRADMTQGNFYIGAEYVYKTDDALVEGQGVVQNILEDKQYDGNALLINMGYSQRGFGLDINLRRLQNIGMFSERNLTGNTFNTGVVNYVPALTKQYDFALQNIYVYQVASVTSFSPYLKPGEIGGQFDLYYQFKKDTPMGGKHGTYFAVNGSFWNALDYQDLDMQNREVSSGFFDFGRKYYNDLAFEMRKKHSDKWQSIFMVMGQYYNQKYIEDASGELKTYVAGADVIYKINDIQSIRVIGQHLWADGDKKNWAAGTLEYVPSMKWSFYVQDLYNYGNDNEDDQIHYYSVGGAFVKGATRIGMSYGRQRGGMICVGGVCRLVPESSGLTLNISTNF